MSNSQPKIVYNEECIDLRSHLGKSIIYPTNKNTNQDPYGNNEWSSRPKTKQERNEVVNTALKKLAKSYNTSRAPFEKKIKGRIRENSLYDPYRKKFLGSQDGNSVKSKSDLSAPTKKESKTKIFSPSSPTVESPSQKVHQKKAEPYRNKFTMTKKKVENRDENHREGRNLKRDKSIDELITKFTLAEQIPGIPNDNFPVWKDHRLSEKYSLLKLPWKRSHTLPILPNPSVLSKEEYRKKLIESSDKKTYLYDDGSEVDSLYFEPKRQQNFGFTLQNQVLLLLNLSAYACALLVITLIVWFVSGNKYFHQWLIPQPPEGTARRYFKLVSGSIIYTLTSIIRFIGSIFSTPSQQVYRPSTEYSWPPVHYNN